MKRALITLALTLTVAAPAMADLALAKAKNCMACHSVDKKLVGPSYKEVAAKYAGQKDAEATLVTHVMKGSKGVWGAVPMPANTHADAVFLAATGTWRKAHEGANTINHAPVMPATMRQTTYQAIGKWAMAQASKLALPSKAAVMMSWVWLKR